MAQVKEKKRKLDYVEFQEGSFFKGVLKHKDPLLISGNFDGEIYSASFLDVAASSVMNAHIHAKEVDFSGKINGNITADEKVILRSGSKVIGNIKTIKLEIEEGVIFDGQSEMLPEDTSQQNQ